MTLEYRQSLTEVNAIINYMNPEYQNKLPKKLINFINNNKDNNYTPNIKEDLPISEQNLKDDTKVLISLLYRNYWCDKETKEVLKKEEFELRKQQEAEIREKYNPDNIFKTQVQDSVEPKNVEVTENNMALAVPQESFFKRLINKIKMIFKIK